MSVNSGYLIPVYNVVREGQLQGQPQVAHSLVERLSAKGIHAYTVNTQNSDTDPLRPSTSRTWTGRQGYPDTFVATGEKAVVAEALDKSYKASGLQTPVGSLAALNVQA